MPELPWVKWYPTDWASEPGLRICEVSTRGIWFEMVNTMFLRGSHKVTGTVEELAALCFCRAPQMELALSELQRFEVAEIVTVTVGNTPLVTVSNRKLERTVKERHRIKLAVREFRQKKNGNGNVTSASASVSVSASKNGESEGKEKLINFARVIIHFLNEQAGRTFTESAVNFSLVCARLKEVNCDVDGVKRMIIRQVARWKGDLKMDEYLRPKTLFGKSNFGEYYDNRDLPVANNQPKNPNPQNVLNLKNLK